MEVESGTAHAGFCLPHKAKLLCIAGDPHGRIPLERSRNWGTGPCRLPQFPSSSRVRIHDLRSDKIALSLSAHQLGVSAVQMDDWKIVSGGEEGLVSVWDYRMNQKLWEVHSR